MKTAKRLMVCALAAAIAVGTVGCGSDGAHNAATDVQIYYWNSGYRLEFMQEIVENFNKKQDEYTVYLDYDSNVSTITSTLGLGEDNTYDLYFTTLNNMMYKPDFITLDDVLTLKPDGENKTIAEKYNPQLLNSLKNADGTTTFLSYGSGWCGIVYNADIIDGRNYEVPVTTDELESLTMDLMEDTALKAKNIKPWIFFDAGNTGAGYWSYPMTVWQVQYDGEEYYYNNMLMLKDENGNAPVKEVMTKQDGRYEALKVAAQVITPASVHPESTNTNFTKVQTLFLQGKAVMMPNGSWLLKESSSDANVRMMKNPVISSIIDVLPDKSVENDEELAALVRAIDMGDTKIVSDNYTYNVTQADYDCVKAARNLMYNNGAEQYVFIPRYSNSIAGAKEFLRYFYSDEGLASFLKHTGCMNSANFTDQSKLDVSTLSAWGKQQAEFGTTMNAISSPLNKASLFLNTGMDSFLGLTYPSAFSAQNKNDRKTVGQLWETLVQRINRNWEEWI